mmetsp:Transcript_10543/g.32464  ORF Transcript_10543/g.32464 Transcript_10543/m.32464 type:complete len:1185 (-) Transcript_10543:68-3622(-)
MPPRRKRAKTAQTADEDEELEEEPASPIEEEAHDDDPEDGDTADVPPPPADDEEMEAFAPPAGDESEDESSDDDAAADAAEARLMKRVNRSETEGASSAGLIHCISMERFMCHEKLDMHFNRRINFINGANGSGKSAILAALQICLGASAKSTHRGNRMGDLVQEGYDGQASVKVVLVNEGTDAARPEIYGDKITIERKFSRRGPAKLLLLGADGQVKSKGKDVKKELRYILDALKVSVDNPVCVLDQENSKHFIRGKAREKYKFFLKATEIDDVQQRIARVNQAASKCLSDAEHQRSRLEGFARLYMQARDEYDEVRRLAMYDEEIKNLKVTIAWVSVRGAERATDAARAKLDDARERIAGLEAQVKELEAAATRQDDMGALEERLTALQKDIASCTTATREANVEVATQQKAVKAAQKKETHERGRIRGFEKEKAQLVKDLSAKRKENAKRTAAQRDGAQAAAVKRLADATAAAEKTLEDAGAALDDAEKEHRDARGGLGELGEAEREAQAASRDARDHANSEAHHARTLEHVASSPLAAFGDYQERLSAEVRKAARSFTAPPVGPVGSRVKLAAAKHKRWAAPLDKVVGKHLGSWIVTNKDDREVLVRIARKLRCDTKVTVVVQKPRPRHAVRAPQGDGLVTVHSLLTVDDDQCFNLLVDLAKIESTCVFPNKDDAERLGLTKGADGWAHAPGVTSLLLIDGAETGARNGNIYVKQGGRVKNVALGVDASKEIPAAKRAAKEAEAVSKKADQDLRAARAAWERAEKADRDLARKRDLAARAKTTAERKVRDAKNAAREATAKADEEVQLEDTAGIEEEIDEVDKETREAEAGVEAAKAEIASEKQKLQPLEAARDAHQQRNAAMAKEVEQVETDMSSVIDGQRKASKMSEKAKAKLGDAARSVQGHEEAVKAEEERRDTTIDKATRFTRKLLGDDWDGRRPPDAQIKKYRNEEAVNAALEQAEKNKQKAVERRGGKETDPAVAKAKMERAHIAYTEKEAGCKQIEKEGHALRADAKKRYSRLTRIRGHICRSSNRTFDDILNKKGSAGQLTFDHDEKLLGMTYQKDNQDESSQIENIQSLSGGERSFSTLAMLIALGATIECPFRVMDEFDVFMDQVSRKVAMRELVDMAKEMKDRQFIFITPQDLSSLPASSLIKVIKMRAPMRGQQTIEGAFAAGRARG